MGRSPLLKDIHPLPVALTSISHPQPSLNNHQSAITSQQEPHPPRLHQPRHPHTQTSLSKPNMATNSQVAADSSSAESARNMFQKVLKNPYGSSLVPEYNKSDAETRRHLFLQMWQELGPVLHLPAADRRLPHCGRLRNFDECSNVSDTDSLVDPYDTQDRFRQEWTTDTPDSSDQFRHYSHDASDMVSWGSFDIYTIPGTPGFVAAHHGRPDGGKVVYTHNLISSQLLLYRLIATFGTAPSNEEVEGYKSIWSYTLHWTSGQEDNSKKGRFVLSDYKGAFTFHFWGPKEASRSALDLLEWLVSDNVPHPYDGVLAGNQA